MLKPTFSIPAPIKASAPLFYRVSLPCLPLGTLCSRHPTHARLCPSTFAAYQVSRDVTQGGKVSPPPPFIPFIYLSRLEERAPFRLEPDGHICLSRRPKQRNIILRLCCTFMIHKLMIYDMLAKIMCLHLFCFSRCETEGASATWVSHPHGGWSCWDTAAGCSSWTVHDLAFLQKGSA